MQGKFDYCMHRCWTDAIVSPDFSHVVIPTLIRKNFLHKSDTQWLIALMNIPRNCNAYFCYYLEFLFLYRHHLKSSKCYLNSGKICFHKQRYYLMKKLKINCSHNLGMICKFFRRRVNKTYIRDSDRARYAYSYACTNGKQYFFSVSRHAWKRE